MAPEKDSGTFYVKGPMGMGLSINLNGHNIVFTGGTGILVFLDLVAVILLQVCGIDTSGINSEGNNDISNLRP